MNIVLLSQDPDDARPIASAAAAAGCNVLRSFTPGDAVSPWVELNKPDALVVVTDEVDGTTLKILRQTTDSNPLPAIIITADSRDSSIASAIRAGATAYVANCYQPERISSVLNVARARFEELQNLRDELDETRKALAERKQIEKAKGILMTQRNLTEDEAYRTIRKLAMDKNLRVGEVAGQIITAASLLL